MCLGCHITPSCPLRNKENTFGCIFVNIFLKAIPFFLELIVLFFKAVRNIFQEYKAEYD